MFKIPCKSCELFSTEACTNQCKFYMEQKEIETFILRDQVLRLPTEEQKAAFVLQILREEGLAPI